MSTSTISRSGGYEGSSEVLTLDSGASEVWLDYRYEHYSIPDRFILMYDGRVVLDTGFTGGSRAGSLKLTPTQATNLQIIVATDNTGTAWNYDVTIRTVDGDCPSTAPYVLSASGDGFVHNATNDRCEAAGLVTIGVEASPRLLEVAGASAWHDDSEFQATGAYRVLIGGVSQTLFTGRYGAAFSSNTGAVTDTGANAPGEYKLAGRIEVEVSALQLTDNRVVATVDFVLPDRLGFLAVEDQALVFTQDGVSLNAQGESDVPDGSFSFLGFFDVSATGQSVSYEHSSLTLKYQGKLEVVNLSKLTPGTVSLDLEGDNYVSISPSGIDFVGELTSTVPSPEFRGFSVKEFGISLDTTANSASGRIVLGLPLKLDVEAGIGFIYAPEFAFNSLTIGLQEINKPIPVAPKFWLQSVSGSVEHIAPTDPDPTLFTLSTEITVGPKVNGEALATIGISGEMDRNHFQGTGNLVVLDEDILRATGQVNLDWSLGTFSVNGNLSMFEGFLTASAYFLANTNFDFGLGGTAAIVVPDRIPLIGGTTISSTNFKVAFTNDGNYGNDFAAAWWSQSLSLFGNNVTRTIGVKLTFDGDFEVIGLSDVQDLGAPNQASAVGLADPRFDVPGGTSLLFLSAKWTAAQAGDVALRVMRPDGSTVEQANFAANGIEVVEELGSQFGKTLAIRTPAAGNWTVEVVDPAPLGTVTYWAGADNAPATLLVNGLSGLNAAGRVNVAYSSRDPDSVAKITFFYDTDNVGFDGVPFATNIDETGGSAVYQWNSDGVAPGTYYVYGVVSDGVNAPVQDYSSNSVTLTRNADVSIAMAGPSAPVAEGTNPVFTITVTNNGTVSANSVSVSDALPAGWRLAASSIVPESVSVSAAQFLLGTINAGASVSFTVELARRSAEFTLPAGASNDTIETATSLDGLFALAADPDVGNSATVPHVTAIATGDGTKDVYAFTVAAPGTRVTFDIDGTNNWDSYLTLRDAAGTVLRTSDDNGGDPGSNSSRDARFDHVFSQAGRYTITVAKYPGGTNDGVAAGSTYRLHVSNPSAEAGTDGFVHTATVRSGTFDPELQNNSATVQTVVQPPPEPQVDLRVTRANLPVDLEIGDAFSYDLVVTNESAVAARNVVLTDIIGNAGGLQVTSSQGVASLTSSGMSAALGELAAGQSVTVTVTGRAFVAGQIYSDANVRSDYVDPDLSDNRSLLSAQVDTILPQAADLSVTVKEAGQDFQGRQLIEIAIRNDGPGIAAGIRVSAPVLAGATLVGSNTIQGTYDAATGIWNAGSIRDGLTRTLTLTVSAPSNLLGTMTASLLSSSAADPDSAPDNGAAAEDDQNTGLFVVGPLNKIFGSDFSQTLNGTAATDAIYARAGDDTVNGGDGADFLFGGDGNDSLLGGLENDVLSGGGSNDVLNGEGGRDTVTFAAEWRPVAVRLDTPTKTATGADSGVDTLLGIENVTGGRGNDTIVGDGAGNVLDGGLGDDAMSGGAGNDVFVVDSAGDTVTETATGGTSDTILSSLTVAVLAANVENLTLTGSAAIGGTGNALSNVLTGNAAGNALSGGEGDDTLDGGLGNDVMNGGAGNDTYFVNVAADQVVEALGGGTQDTVLSLVTISALAAHVENLVLIGGAAVDGTGNSLSNALTGNANANALTGGDGNDTLNGKQGLDVLTGGAGNDTYVFEDAVDQVTEAVGGGTADTVLSAVTVALLAANVENLVLTGGLAIDGTGNALANSITGNAAANRLNGGGNGDTMTGGDGDDIYVVDSVSDTVVETSTGGAADEVQTSVTLPVLANNVEKLLLTGAAAINGTGNALANVLTGNSAANVLDGRGGLDVLIGGAGNDTYIFDGAADVVTENVGGGVADLIRSSVTIAALAANVENLTLTGVTAINGAGNALANIITGNAAANILDGAAGNDTLIGGGGNDTYLVDSVLDKVVESATGGSADHVLSQVSIALLAANVENLTLTGLAAINGTGNALTNTITGNAAANVLNGGIGNDRLVGGAGNDTYIVESARDVVVESATGGTLDTIMSSVTIVALASNVENLVLTGNAAIDGTGNSLANAITGNSAANNLDGGLGADRMSGGAGNDTYVVNSTLDSVFETAAGGTADHIFSSVSIVALAANVERLTLTGAGALNATGNALANVMTGNSGANVLDGGLGADTLTGGGGNDTYVVNSALDIVVEAAGGGTRDLIQSSVTISALADNVENLTLTGASPISGTGNALANIITGNGNANVLTGAGGLDTLIGGLGADRFAFGALNDGMDYVADFTSGTDRIAVASAAFGATVTLVSGALPVAPGAGPVFLYNTTSRILSFDADGNGAGAAVSLARFSAGVVLASTDFVVF